LSDHNRMGLITDFKDVVLRNESES
jgi:hypothetical protein